MIGHPQQAAGDVLVIGAGAAGLMTLALLEDAGYSCTLVETDGYGAGQSNHSHGYLHSGYIYVNGSTGLVRPLARGSAHWRDLLRRQGVLPVSETSTVAFSSRLEARHARRAWKRSGLALEPANAPVGVHPRALAASFRTPEPSYDFTRAWELVAAGLQRTRRIRGTLLRLRVEGGRVAGADVAVQGEQRPLALRAGVYVVAAGWNNAGLMRRTVRYRGRAISRLSHMMIAAGDALPPLSLIVPSHDRYGLFAVSRPLATGGNAWLVSNYLSMAFDSDPAISLRLWMNATLQSLDGLAPILRDPSLLWGVYPAPKGELRDVPGEMQSYSCESYGLANLLALAPTKLTLAPLLAEEAAHRAGELAGTPGQRAPLGVAPADNPAALSVLPERWTREQLVPLVDASGSVSGYVKELAGARRSPWSCPGLAAIGSI